MTLSEDTLDAIDAYVRSMQLSAWRGRPYAEYQQAWDAGVERLASLAATQAEADEIRTALSERSEYEGDEEIVDSNGIIVWKNLA